MFYEGNVSNIETIISHQESPNIRVEKMQSRVRRSPRHVVASDFSSGMSAITAEAKKEKEKV